MCMFNSLLIIKSKNCLLHLKCKLASWKFHNRARKRSKEFSKNFSQNVSKTNHLFICQNLLWSSKYTSVQSIKTLHKVMLVLLSGKPTYINVYVMYAEMNFFFLVTFCRGIIFYFIFLGLLQEIFFSIFFKFWSACIA